MSQEKQNERRCRGQKVSKLLGGGLGIFLSLVLLLTLFFSVSGRAAAQQGKKVTLSLITTPVGSDSYTIAVGQGVILNKKLSNFTVAAQPIPSALAIPRLLANGEAQIATMAAPTMYWAFAGQEGFSPPLTSLRILQSGNDMLFGLVTRKADGMQKIDELRGKRVTCDFPAAKLLTTIGLLELQAYGLDPQKDVKLLKAEFTPVAINNLMEKRTDAVLGSLSGSKMAEAESKAGLRVLPFEESKVPFLRQRLPALYAAKAPSGMPGVTPGSLWLRRLMSPLYQKRWTMKQLTRSSRFFWIITKNYYRYITISAAGPLIARCETWAYLITLARSGITGKKGCGAMKWSKDR